MSDASHVDEQFRLVAERWPATAEALRKVPRAQQVTLAPGVPFATLQIDGIQLCGAVRPEEEASLQAKRVPAGATSATLYGPAQGALARSLLARAELESLEVVVLAPAAFREVLERFDQRDWLRDPRVTLRLARDDERPRTPWAVSPAELRLCEPRAVILRDHLVLALSARFQQAQFAAREEELSARMQHNLPRIARDGDVASLFGTHPGGHAVIAGAGPTLVENLPWLQLHRSELRLYAATTALRTLMNRGVIPDVVVAVDPALTLLKHVVPPQDDEFLQTAFEYFSTVPLVYGALVAPEVIAAWRGPTLAAYMRHPRYDQVAAVAPRGRLWSSGTVVHAAVDLAAQAGASTLTLLGVDFGYPGGRSHAQGAPDETAVSADTCRFTVRNGYGEPLPTDINLMGYLRDLEDWVVDHPDIRVRKRGRAGAAIQGVPCVEGIEGIEGIDGAERVESNDA